MQGRKSRRTHRLGSASLGLQTASDERLAVEPLEERRMLAGTPELLKDINATTEGSSPSIIGVFRDEAYFATDAGELWKTDGTTEGTRFVANVAPGVRNEGAIFNDRLYFFQHDASSSHLWITDGTAAGTVVVRDTPTGADWRPSYLQATSHSLLFIARDASHGRELWTSDGSAAGTRMVKDISPGAASSLNKLVLVGDTAYFSANDGTHGVELWRSDGTEAGTSLVADIRVGSGGSNPGIPTDVNGTLYFSATDSSSNTGLWKTDGTAQGTELVKQMPVGALSNFNGQLYFGGGASSLNRELWKSDGTAAGTVLVKEIHPTGSAQPVNFQVYDGRLYFQATSNHGLGGWTSDGTEMGTSPVAGLDSIPDVEMVVPWGRAGESMSFATLDVYFRLRLWSVQGSDASQVRTFENPTSWGFSTVTVGPRNLRVFVVNDGTSGYEVWRTDGTGEGTFLLRDINTTPTPNGSDPESFIEVGETTFFLAKDAQHGQELWRTDGTSSGTRLVKDVEPGARSSYIYGMANVSGTLLFSDSYRTGENLYSSALWRSDGTEEGTVLVHEFTGQGYSPWFDDAQVIDGVVYFRGWDAAAGHELWRSDGTAAGTWLVADLMPGASDSYPSDLTNVDGVLHFAAETGSGYDLWRSDGTAAGTVRVKDLAPNSSSSIYRIVAAEGRLYFFERNAGSQFTLWTSDGSEDGTISLGSAVSVLDSATVGDTLYFERREGTVTRLFATDGTVAGTRPLREGFSDDLTNVGGTLYFTSGGLWKTDGTVEGTVLVKAGNAVDGWPDYLRNVNGTLFFRSGDALWKSDGTEAGTVLVDDSLVVDNLYAVGNKLYILNHDPVIGVEPWVLQVPAKVVSRQLFYNDSAFDGGSAVANAAAANAADDGAIAPDKSAYLPGSGRSTTASVSSYVHGINGVMIDIAGLEGDLTADDFVFRVGTNGSSPESWAIAPTPLEIAVRIGAGANGSDRVTITWANGAVKNTWLQVTVQGNDAAGGFNANTGLAESDVFFFGSRVGDTFEGAAAFSTATTSRDELAARFGVAANQSLTSLLDFNRDGVVSAVDQLIARQNIGVLRMLEIEEIASVLVASRGDSDTQAGLAFALALGDGEEADDAPPAEPWRRSGRRSK